MDAVTTTHAEMPPLTTIRRPRRRIPRPRSLELRHAALPGRVANRPALLDAKNPEVVKTVDAFLGSGRVKVFGSSKKHVRGELLQIARTREGRGALRATVAMLKKLKKKVTIKALNTMECGGMMYWKRHTGNKKAARRKGEVDGFTLEYGYNNKDTYFYKDRDTGVVLEEPSFPGRVLAHELAHLLNYVGAKGAQFHERSATSFSESSFSITGREYLHEFDDLEEYEAIQGGAFNENQFLRAFGKPPRIDHSGGDEYDDLSEISERNLLYMLEGGNAEGIERFMAMPESTGFLLSHGRMVLAINAASKNPTPEALEKLLSFPRISSHNRRLANGYLWEKKIETISPEELSCAFDEGAFTDSERLELIKYRLITAAVKNPNPDTLETFLSRTTIDWSRIRAVLTRELKNNFDVLTNYKVRQLIHHGANADEVSIPAILSAELRVLLFMLSVKDRTGETRYQRAFAKDQITLSDYYNALEYQQAGEYLKLAIPQQKAILEGTWESGKNLISQLWKRDDLDDKTMESFVKNGISFASIDPTGIIGQLLRAPTETLQETVQSEPCKSFLAKPKERYLVYLLAKQMEMDCLIHELVKIESDLDRIHDMTLSTLSIVATENRPETIKYLLNHDKYDWAFHQVDVLSGIVSNALHSESYSILDLLRESAKIDQSLLTTLFNGRLVKIANGELAPDYTVISKLLTLGATLSDELDVNTLPAAVLIALHEMGDPRVSEDELLYLLAHKNIDDVLNLPVELLKRYMAKLVPDGTRLIDLLKEMHELSRENLARIEQIDVSVKT
ncbi:MAG: hypothetical protein MRY21_06220 [Simkaniaceae bacterium]|nr:hypothetical protein [Simkaniaceae bacterium]